MSNTVISVENLGKKYTIRHQQQSEKYTTLRDVVAKSFKGLVKRLQKSETNLQRPNSEEFWALKDVSFEIKQGDCVGIIGRNGAGKSTLLKLLSRITEPTKGRIRLKGRVASLLEVGTGFHPELTGRENIFLNGAILGMGKEEIKRKFDEIVAFAEVEKFLDTPVKRYSSGMYVRLAFAVAAHLEPEILVVDEVLAVGDATFQKKCLGKMGDVSSKEGRTVLFVSHNVSSIQRLCTRALLLEQGSVRLDGDVATAVEQYLAVTDKSTNDSQFNLLNYPRTYRRYTDILFRKCLILDSLGNISSNLRLGEPFTVHLEIISQSYYDDLSLIVGINSATQTRISTVISSDFGRLFKAKPGFPLRVNVSFDELVLCPGSYSLSIAVRTGQSPLDNVKFISTFKVSLLTHGDTPPHTKSWGMVKTRATWHDTSVEYVPY